jgi:predicted aconitase with swiveling domain
MDLVKRFKAKEIVPGRASGPALVTRERVSFHGFIDPEQGIFSSPATELRGSSFAGRVMVFTSGKGASAGPRVLDVACRFGHAPAAIVNLELEPFIVQGCVMQNIPLVQVEDETIFDHIKNGDIVTVDSGRGEVTLTPAKRGQSPADETNGR